MVRIIKLRNLAYHTVYQPLYTPELQTQTPSTADFSVERKRKRIQKIKNGEKQRTSKRNKNKERKGTKKQSRHWNRRHNWWGSTDCSI
jgi:hypothetical protein